MKEKSILICDSDRSYAEALMRFLIGSRKDLRIVCDTSVESFLREKGRFSIALMTEEYLKADENEGSGERIIEHRIQLCGYEEIGYKEYESIYKFQDMDLFLDRLCQIDWEVPAGKRKDATSETKFTGIYSPMKHELMLPFSILYSRLLADREKVMFLDLEENSILSRLTGRNPRSNLLDCIYDIETSPAGFNLSSYTDVYEGISYIGPVLNPSDLASVTEKQWIELFDKIREADFGKVVILFGDIPQGFDTMLILMDAMIILGKPGEYYKEPEKRFMEFIKKQCDRIEIREVMLPMSAAAVSDDRFAMKDMIHGNLGLFMRKNFCGAG